MVIDVELANKKPLILVGGFSMKSFFLCKFVFLLILSINTIYSEQTIIEKTEKEEAKLGKDSDKAKKDIDERLLKSYEKIRKTYRNGLAVVSIQRDSCGGCFNKIPPQRQLDIQARKKIIVCEHCGRILVEPPKVAEKA